MALPPQMLAQRIKSAREEAGLRQSELSAFMEEDGHGKTDIGRLERPDGKQKPPKLTAARLHSLSKFTGMPEAWFTEPDVYKAFDASRTPLSVLEARVGQLEEGQAARAEAASEIAQTLLEQGQELASVRRDQEAMLRRLELLERGGEGSGS